MKEDGFQMQERYRMRRREILHIVSNGFYGDPVGPSPAA